MNQIVGQLMSMRDELESLDPDRAKSLLLSLANDASQPKAVREAAGKVATDVKNLLFASKPTGEMRTAGQKAQLAGAKAILHSLAETAFEAAPVGIGTQ